MTVITLREAAIGRGAQAELPPLSLAVAPGAPIVVAVETDERPMLLSMLIGHRMRPDAGSVESDARDPRSSIALVDTPFVAEPVPSLSVRRVVREELALAGRSTRRPAVDAALDASGVRDWANAPIRVLPAADRIRLLVDLALARPGVDTVVLTSPERHGGDPAGWFPALAERDATVVVITDAPTRDLLIPLGARDALAPVESR
jgi:ABC-2 type transport system ATP-binding protein